MESRVGEGEKVGRDFDDSACEFCEDYKKAGLSRSSKILFDLLVEDGVKDKSVLELGSGAGGFSIELLRHGASNVVGIDLSPEMVKVATELSRESGFGDRAKFEQGNGAIASLPRVDIVIMDKVICCYSDIGSLLKNATGASQSIVGFVAPRGEGLLKWPLRFGVWIVNIVEKRRHRILFYVHSLEKLEKTLQDSGFTLQKKRGSRMWLGFFYKLNSQSQMITILG